MNIVLPIITNLIMLLIIIAGVFIGRKKGFAIEFSKFLLLAGGAVGCYFATLPLCQKLIELEFIANLITTLGLSVFSFVICVLSILILIWYGFISIPFAIIYRKKYFNKVITKNNAKAVKAKGIDKATERALRKEEKKLRKLQRTKKQLKVRSKVFGSIFAVLSAVVIIFAIMLPYRFIAYDVSEKAPVVYSGYEYTALGQLDKVFNVGEKLIEGWIE